MLRSVFVDANVFLDVMWGRRESSRKMLEALGSAGVEIFTSYMVVLELIDKEQERIFSFKMLERGMTLDWILRNRRNRRLTKEERRDAINKVFKILDDYGVHLIVPRDETVWKKAALIMEDLNVESNDALHIASALSADCDAFITRDERLGNQVNQLENIRWLKPEEVLEELLPHRSN